MGNSLGMLAAKEPDFQIHGLVKFQLFGSGGIAHHYTCQHIDRSVITADFCVGCPS